MAGPIIRSNRHPKNRLDCPTESDEAWWSSSAKTNWDVGTNFGVKLESFVNFSIFRRVVSLILSWQDISSSSQWFLGSLATLRGGKNESFFRGKNDHLFHHFPQQVAIIHPEWFGATRISLSKFLILTRKLVSFSSVLALCGIHGDAPLILPLKALILVLDSFRGS